MTVDDKIVRLREILSEAKSEKEPAPPRKRTARKASAPTTQSGINQTANGDGNTQTVNIDKLFVQSGKGAPSIAPPPGSIGANAAMTLRIQSLLKEIEEFRYKRIGKEYRFGTIHGQMARAFGIKSSKNWKNIFLWGEAEGEEIIQWLNDRRHNTIQGKIEKAASRDGYKHTRGHLFRIEKEYLATLEWSDAEMRQKMEMITGRRSRRDIGDEALRNWVAYLGQEVDRLVE